jgi:hypothetical protein
MKNEHMARLGPVEVSASTLDGVGSPLLEFLESRGLDTGNELRGSDAPESGWRVLPTAHDRDGFVLIGAPLDDGQWFLGQLTKPGTQWELSLHGPVTRIPSRVERGVGLELRWPDAAADAPVDEMFVDVLNIGPERWVPMSVDDFYTVGMLVEAGEDVQSPQGYNYAYVGGQSPAFILDPGEYARVRVDIGPDKINGADAGRYAVYAAVPALGLTTEIPLTVAVTPGDLDRAAARLSPPHRRGERPEAPPTNGR